MIQRIQTLWFLLAATCGFAMTKIPLFSATFADNTLRQLIATESFLLFAVMIGLMCLALVCIFLFKNRTLQLTLAIIGMILSMCSIVLVVYKIEEFKKANAILSGTYQWGGLFPIAMTIFFFMAARGVYKDERLVKSLDRLR